MRKNSSTPKGKSQAISIAAPLHATRESGTGHTSVALMKNIASPKDPSLFDGEEIAERELRISQEISNYGMERRGKPIFLSNQDTKLSILLSTFINTHDPDVEAFILWTERAEEFGLKEAGTQPNPIARTFSLRELTKIMNNGRSDKEKIQKTREALKRLRETEQVMYLGKKGVKVTSKLIMRELSVEDLTSQDRGLDQERIVFGTIFLWNLKKRFGYISPKAWEVWGRRGSGTENDLFPILFSTLHSLCFNFQYAAKQARANLKKEFTKNDYTPDHKEQLRKERIEEALTYRESVELLKSRIRTDYSSSKRRRHEFTKDFQAAVEALKEIGIITSGTIQKGRGKRGQDLVVFKFNENYKDQKELPDSSSDDGGTLSF